MSANALPAADERTGLLEILAQQRTALKAAAHGLTDEQARAVPSASALSVGGLVKHVAATENNWIDMVLRVPQKPFAEALPGMIDSHTFGPAETLEATLAEYARTAARTEQAIAGITDLTTPVPVPKDVPWYPADLDAWTVRWVLLHLIEETARHAGHADIIRESLDGATALPLQAAMEGWPATEWIKPWTPAS
ncbi:MULTISPECIES: DinB family protein [Amycolatopsis]|uniref:Uncharacterized protein DUF664 n=2 Tax=Amycolatopsis TaxID=1813 RepID=A0A2A9F9U8_9PSEU|nr:MULTISPECIES: DinB family protein [Amycolatopsis]PFG47209.1 uncharacterized protein DUF664 [Amycolatopsis sulphurea]RJQ79517.1 DinB family protein [Amycolatopsis panacis]